MSNNKSNKSFSYCFRVYNYEQYLHAVGELRAMGYTIADKYNAHSIQTTPSFRGLWLHIDYGGQPDIYNVVLFTHDYLSERVPNLEYIINELPVLKSSESV